MKSLIPKTLLMIVGLFLIAATVYAQVPQKFNYQAIARDNAGDPIIETSLDVRIAIIFGSPGGTILWEEQQTITTNSFGLFTIHVGDLSASKSAGILDAFADVDWQTGPLYLRPSVFYQATWKQMDASPVVSVPYSLVAQRVEVGQFPVNGDTIFLPQGSLAIGSNEAGGSKLAVISQDDESDDPLFEVKRADGQTIFAVYNDAVRAFVAPVVETKGRARGGFAVAGFNRGKATLTDELFWLTPDSIRFYVDDTNPTGKGARGGFAVAGFNRGKGPGGAEYFNISSKSDISVIDSATQIAWYPMKNAILAGTIHVGSPDSVGYNSVAMGHKSIAMGNFSQAFGFGSKALGNLSMAVGDNAVASGANSYSIGQDSEAAGNNSYAMGQNAKANSVNSLSMGFYSSAGSSSIAIGKFAEADGSESTALGINSSAVGFQSTSIGPISSATEQGALALGLESNASKSYAFAAGYQATADGIGSSSIGYGAISSGDYSTALTGSNASGTYSFAVNNASASGFASSAIGWQAKAGAYRSVVIGSGGEATGDPDNWVETDPIFVIGNSRDGTSNAMNVLKNGNVGIGGEPGNFKLYVAGDAFTTGSWEASDRTLKTNIGSITNAIEKVTTIDGVKFDFRTDEYPDMGLPAGSHYGVLAQDIRITLPELVREGPEGKLSVAYGEIIPILVEAFKEQQSIIESRSSRLAELEAENADIKARLEALEALVTGINE